MNLRSIATDIFHRTLAAIEVENVVRQSLHLDGEILTAGASQIGLANFSRVIVLAIGKAAVPMAQAAANILGERITDGFVATNELAANSPPNFRSFEGGHPIPNQGSIDGAQAALELLQSANDKKTLVLFLLSGGGSALFEKPISDAITLADLQTINRVLVGCGAVISEMNIARRFLSAVKGGRLAEAANKARQVSLYISDVNSDDLSTISSGLTLPSNATREDFERIVTQYSLREKFPPHVSALLDELPAMPPPIVSASRSHHLLLDNRVALQIARKIAEENYNCVVEVAEDLVEGEVDEMAATHLARLQTLRTAHPGKIVCLLSGGEVICPVRGNGQGGRNQEFVLRAALQNQFNSVAILSAGTDGIDGHSPAAGAIADETTLQHAAEKNIAPQDYLQRSDSYNFFAALNDAIVIGPTGNNVRDLRIFLVA